MLLALIDSNENKHVHRRILWIIALSEMDDHLGTDDRLLILASKDYFSSIVDRWMIQCHLSSLSNISRSQRNLALVAIGYA